MFEAFDRSLTKRAILDNAFNRTERLSLNGVNQLAFSLPGDDAKAAYCQPFHFIHDGNNQYYRLLVDGESVKDTGERKYEAEHAIATLVDDVMFGIHQVGGRGYRTRAVIEYILSKQTTRRWALGDCDFDRQFEYGFESENLLNALFSVPNLFTENYIWEYDMRTYPWKVHLRRLDVEGDPQFYIRAGKNLIASTATRTGTEVCTRLYLRGYGEGDNQLTISRINGGKPYLQSPQAYIDKYGLVSKVFVDRRFELEESLMERGRTLLEALQEPQYRRTFKVADLHQLTKADYDKAELGRIVRLAEDGTNTFITGIRRKLDVDGDMDIEMSTTPMDIAAEIADIADRQRIEQVYSQGATQIYAQSIQANADASTPAVLNFFIPPEMRIINRVAAKISLDRFRSYSRVTSGGGRSTRTSSEGGGSTQTSSSGGGSSQTSSNGGGASSNTGGGGETTLSAAARVTSYQNATSMPLVNGYQTTVTEMSTTSSTGSGGSGSTLGATSSTSSATVSSLGSSHSHSVNSHTHVMGTHTHSVPAHQHGFNHTHSVTVVVTVPEHSHAVPPHSHSFTVNAHTHQVTIPAHTHNVSTPSHTHQVDIPDHTHSIEQGIFRFGNPQSAQIQINGTTKATMESEREIDLTALLLNDSGLIPRGSWLKLGILPNDLAYVTIDIYIQGFVQSRGGGTY